MWAGPRIRNRQNPDPTRLTPEWPPHPTRMPLRRLAPLFPDPCRLLRSLNPSHAMPPAASAAHLATAADPDEDLCAGAAADAPAAAAEEAAPAPPLLPPPVSAEERVERAWAHWRRLGSPRLMVAPMVDNSELPFRMLCRRYGADAAYTPMLHSRIFSENEKHRSMEFTTCKEDRPLFVQFCANDPDILLQAAKMVEPYCDYVDINFGCPQRIARRGNYGAFLMDNLPLVKSLVQNLSANLHVPVSCKIRIFPRLEDTLAYAKMLEEAGASLVAVHGRTRDEKDGKKFRANWDAIKAVKDALRVPVLANGNVRHMEDVKNCLEHTGCDGVMSAETLLENPALFAGFRTKEWKEDGDESGDSGLDQADLVIEYLKLCEQYPVPWRMIRSHIHKMLGDWFRAHLEVREEFNKQSKLTFEWLHDMVMRLKELGGGIPLYRKESALQATTNGLAASNA